MKRVRKGKKTLLKIIVALIIIVAVIVLIVRMINNKDKNNNTDLEISKSKVESFDLPDTELNDMKVTDIVMEYLIDNNETMITMTINNTTGKSIEKELVEATLVDPAGEILTKTSIWIDSLKSGEKCNSSVVVKGDQTATAEIKLDTK